MLAFLSTETGLDPSSDPAKVEPRAMHPTRQRLVLVATRLFQQRGLHAVGLNEILALAEAPKGSLYHHFPGGKQELAEACIARIASATFAAIDAAQASGIDITRFLQQLSADTGKWLEDTSWCDGSLLAVIGQEEGGQDSAVGDAVRIAYQRIEMRLAKWLIVEGVAVTRARDIAATIIAAHEGALVLARSRRDAAPLKLVADMLSELIERG
ncbi:TetR/AcrR family transcriptional regulator [Blastomonas sp.]|uniref:TetR/AcrR family transcriptional regulator n=1 Tax=Blastomonas sp. TaxID=1909299 RepID=UPI0035930708